jgi:hypothetical protein
MARYKDYIPENEKDFVPWSTNYMLNLTALVSTIKVPPEAVSALGALYNDFEEKYNIAENETTRNKLTVAAKNAALKKLKAGIRQMTKEYIISNHLVTDEQLLQLGLPIHDKKPTPVPTPTSRVVAEAKVIGPGEIDFHIRDEGAGKSLAKPHGVTGCEGGFLISDTEPANWDDLVHSVYTTTSVLKLQFPNDQRGKRLWIAFRWENTRGEKGPWCEIMNVIIP